MWVIEKVLGHQPGLKLKFFFYLNMDGFLDTLFKPVIFSLSRGGTLLHRSVHFLSGAD